MFSDKVAQNPTMPVRPGTKNAQKAETEVKCEGCVSMGPSPPCTCDTAHHSRASAARGRKKALNTSNFRILSTPSQTTYIFSSQNRRKHIAGPVASPQDTGSSCGSVSSDGIQSRSIWYRANPPIQ